MLLMFVLMEVFIVIGFNFGEFVLFFDFVCEEFVKL